MNQPLFVCHHDCCAHLKDAKRIGYVNQKSCSRHERVGVHHVGCSPKCPACLQWKGAVTVGKRKREPAAYTFKCSHQGCDVHLTTNSNIIRHELHDLHTHCITPCPRCTTAEQTWKKKHEKQEAEILLMRNLEQQQREAMVQTTREAVQGIDWEPALMAESNCERKQAEVSY